MPWQYSRTRNSLAWVALLVLAWRSASAEAVRAERLVPERVDAAADYAIVRLWPVTDSATFSAYLLPPGADPGDDFRVAALFPRFSNGTCDVHLRG